jgi:predicted nucleotide-binding protein (sugar kinase/HSP70/actin superfamily)
MANVTNSDVKKKVGLPLIDAEASMKAELDAFEAEERKRLGLDVERDQWVEKMANASFTMKEREEHDIEILVCGLTMAHDYFIEGALRGLGYKVTHLDVPDNDALRFGKEFGNRGQCNPTYFTVGNLVKFLSTLHEKGMSREDIVKKYVFLTAGACGPCRFGMYVTEYRKALRDAGFDGFRVMLFQQTGGFQQATGEEAGLQMNPPFFISLVKAILAGDVLNAIGYRIRPYEVEPGSTNAALEEVKKDVYQALQSQKSVFRALWRGRQRLKKVKVNKLLPKPKVSIIGEFWAMTTEGDGNYQLQSFLEGEGAEADIQLVAAWLLYTIWEGRNDIKERMMLRGSDNSKYGLAEADQEGVTAIAKKRAVLSVADKAVRIVFHSFALFAGLEGYHLPNMDEIAEISHKYYNNDLRGGEGHMEVGKLILNVAKSKAHMTLSVKPFGCMPSAGVSDGVQSLITELYPGTIFCPVETSGDGRVNFYSRVQMYLFKAKQAAQDELERALALHGVTKEQVEAYLAKHPKYASPLHKPPHAAAGSGADLVHQVAPLMTIPAWKRAKDGVVLAFKKAQKTAPKVVASVKTFVNNAPELVQMAKEDLSVVTEVVRGKLNDQWLELGAALIKKHDDVHDAHDKVGTVPVVNTGHVAAAE